MKINIKDKEVELKQTIRSYILYENITGKSPDDVKTFTDICIYFYCILVSSNKSLELKFDDYLDIIDDDPTIISQFTAWLLELAEQNNQLVGKTKESKKSKKK